MSELSWNKQIEFDIQEPPVVHPHLGGTPAFKDIKVISVPEASIPDLIMAMEDYLAGWHGDRGSE